MINFDLIFVLVGGMFSIIGALICVYWYVFWQRNYDGKIITYGPYSFVRHPKYLGDLLMMIGATLLMGSLYGILISVAGIPLIVIRIFG